MRCWNCLKSRDSDAPASIAVNACSVSATLGSWHAARRNEGGHFRSCRTSIQCPQQRLAVEAGRGCRAAAPTGLDSGVDC